MALARERNEAPALARRVVEERTRQIAEAKATVEAMQRAMDDAQQAALQLQAERDALNAGAPADSPQAFAARWERIAILDGAIANGGAWVGWWAPRLQQAEAEYRTALRVAPLAFEQAMEASIGSLFAEVERLRTSPHRARPEVQRQYEAAVDAYEVARRRWAAAWSNRPQ